MKSVIFFCSVPVLLSAALAFAQAPVPDASSQTSAQIMKTYHQLPCLTSKEFIVNPELAMLCIGASQKDLERAEKVHGPHSLSSILVYANPAALQGLQKKQQSFPVGATIVKEKHLFPTRDRTKKRRDGIGGMIKRAPGYDPANGDWEYFFQEENGELETGKLTRCVACHTHASGPDHVFATWYSPKTK